MDKQTEIETLMEQTKGDRYEQINRKVEDSTDFSVTEYLTPKGEIGYQMYFYETRVDGEYRKSVGKGVEEKDRTFDWTKLDLPNGVN